MRGGGRAHRARPSPQAALYSGGAAGRSQAEPAWDAPAPRVGALALPLVLQHLVPEVLIRGAASGPFSLGKQIWEREGLPERLRTKQTGSAQDPGRVVHGETELPAPRQQDRRVARRQTRGPGLRLPQQKPLCDRPLLMRPALQAVSALEEPSKAPAPSRSCQARLQAGAQVKQGTARVCCVPGTFPTRSTYRPSPTLNSKTPPGSAWQTKHM